LEFALDSGDLKMALFLGDAAHSRIPRENHELVLGKIGETSPLDVPYQGVRRVAGDPVAPELGGGDLLEDGTEDL
jgi:hypothetical protein